tara:strand:+ start:1246 stop:1458 length:213 start_codon:yes stop_codon:yes gene_type:complete
MELFKVDIPINLTLSVFWTFSSGEIKSLNLKINRLNPSRSLPTDDNEYTETIDKITNCNILGLKFDIISL